MRKKSLLEVPWETVLAEHLFERVPKEILAVRCPKFEKYRKVAQEYLAVFPESVPNAIDVVAAEWGDYAGIDNVLEWLSPPLVEWARGEKDLRLNDCEGSLY